MVNCIAHIGISVVIDIAHSHPSVAEVPRLIDRPVARPVAEPDHDTVFLCVYVRRSVIAHGNQIGISVEIHICKLNFNWTSIQGRRFKPIG